uniref:Uncharacterized protein n=1 Tax=Sphaerodactylus townsendi TaxID=933632 RepID=A0ACB8E9R8_9SAUR
MGTVPESLRSARLSLVAAPEEKNGPREPQSPRSQRRQASMETNSNGFPLPAKAQTAGERLLDVSCAPAEDKHVSKEHCGYDTNQASPFSQGPLSRSSEVQRVIPEPASNSEQKGSGDLAAAEGCVPLQKAVKKLSTQEADEIMQSDSRGQVCRASDKQVSPAAKEAVGAKAGPERTHLPMQESDAASDPGVNPSVCLDAELMARKDSEMPGREDPSPHPRAEVRPKAAHEPSCESAAQPSCKPKGEEKAAAEVSKFKDTGTMTVQLDSWGAGGEAVRRDRQDAEVQAVATVEDKSASTSPSISASSLRESLHPETKPKQEQSHVISTGGGGSERSGMADGFAPLLQTAPSVSIMLDVHVQAPAPVDVLGIQTARLQNDPVGMHSTVCSALADSRKHPCSLISSSTPETPVDRVEAQKAGASRNRSDSQQLSDASVLSKTRPVYQITVNSSNQPPAPPQPVNVETNLPPSAVLSHLDSKHPAPGPHVAEINQDSPSCHQLSEQAVCTIVSTHGSKRGSQSQSQTGSGLETGPDSSHVDVKPKREEKFIPLHPSEQEMGKMGAAAGPQTECSPSVGKSEQHKFPEHNKEVKLSGSQRLATGLESESRRSPSPARGPQVARGSEIRKETKLGKMASPALHKLHFTGNKKEPRPTAEAKVQVKQSKRVRDVVWDEQGMTWEVYGASLDPESLGIAIQNHLTRQIREHEKLLKSQSAPNRKSISSDTSSNKKLKRRQHNVFHSVLQNFRRPNCCVRPTASSVLD